MGRKRPADIREVWNGGVDYLPLRKLGVETMDVKLIKPPTPFHALVREKIRANTMTFLIGCAGTGKSTYAVQEALFALKEGAVKKIIITRPAITANENHGFLPGSLDDKMMPYMLPVTDAIDLTVGVETRKKLLEEELVEIAPVGFCRGRTFADAFVVVDEVQNCTAEQLVMILTRMGHRSKMVLNGDPSQSDLGKDVIGAFTKIWHLANRDIPGVAYVHYDKSHIVRPKIVRDILEALEAE